MAPPRLSIPENAAGEWAIYRGDDWDVKVRFHTDRSAETFLCELRHTRRGVLVAEVAIDTTHLSDPIDAQNPTADPYLLLHLDGEVTATIVDDLLEGDLQSSGRHTLFRFVVPVMGQDTQAATV